VGIAELLHPISGDSAHKATAALYGKQRKALKLNTGIYHHYRFTTGIAELLHPISEDSTHKATAA
jgi:hypothetical protein